MNPRFLVVLIATGCATSPSSPTSQPSSQPASQAASQPASQRRAADGIERLSQTPAGQIVLGAIERHGGLEKWFAGGALTFRYAYRPVGDRPGRVSTQTIDLIDSRAYHTLEEPMKGEIAWDGAQAWSKLEGDGDFAARFWALTPYYFVAMPFVLGDPGVRLDLSEDDPTQAGFPADTDVVKATFDPGTGDAPDDYYVLYFAADDHRLLGLRYIVTYFDRPGGPKEKLLVYEDEAPAGPLTLARTHTTYAFGEGVRGEKVTESKIDGVVYGATFDASRLTMPEGAKVDAAKPAGT
ncbi:MAG: hypothetical protein RMA76_09390 [Deltaproteobacteria bacterium]